MPHMSALDHSWSVDRYNGRLLQVMNRVGFEIIIISDDKFELNKTKQK